ncbi:MAG: alcohol dehydrogenase catalytic domain-containing protein [Planctomycetota bacterium]|nr:alcohol dehydrogenase catalytic domain-containing protein [Planctomycetota bacterium]MDA1113833.1 alcohol dehydrogenase catalytic domain-containing protein [Planctomycetota bacterium]
MNNSSAFRWLMTAPGAPLERREFELPAPASSEVIVRVVGCGICHTDLGFLHGGVRTNHELPIALGHEIAGTVEAVGDACEEWAGKDVVIPAVLPCGACELCNAGRETSCRNQKMPGNDFHGGFASHVIVPAQWLVDASNLPGEIELADVAVLADAVTTPYQAMLRADVQPGDGVVLIGAGGIGSFGMQIAKAFGARVVAIDIDDEKLARAAEFGADGTVNTRGLEINAVLDAAQAHKIPQRPVLLP